MIIHHSALDELMRINKRFPLKPGSNGEPGIYLGGNLSKVTMLSCVEAVSLSPCKYVTATVNNIIEDLKDSLSQPKKASIPFRGGWVAALRRVDIITELSILSLFLAKPRQGNLEAI